MMEPRAEIKKTFRIGNRWRRLGCEIL